MLKTSDYSEANRKLNITGSGRPNEEGCDAVSSGCHAVNANPRVGADTGVRVETGCRLRLIIQYPEGKC